MLEMPLVSFISSEPFSPGLFVICPKAPSSVRQNRTLTRFWEGQSGLATDETTKETTERNSYSTSDPGNKKNTIADQLSSTSTGNTSAAAGDSNVSRGNGPDSTHSRT